MSDFLTVQEVARMASVGEYAIRYHLTSGKVRGAKRAADGRWMIPASEAMRLAARRRYQRGPLVSA